MKNLMITLATLSTLLACGQNHDEKSKASTLDGGRTGSFFKLASEINTLLDENDVVIVTDTYVDFEHDDCSGARSKAYLFVEDKSFLDGDDVIILGESTAVLQQTAPQGILCIVSYSFSVKNYNDAYATLQNKYGVDHEIRYGTYHSSLTIGGGGGSGTAEGFDRLIKEQETTSIFSEPRRFMSGYTFAGGAGSGTGGDGIHSHINTHNTQIFRSKIRSKGK